MGTFRLMSRTELRTRRRLSAEEVEVFDQFKGYLTRMSTDDVVVYEFSKNEDRVRSKKLLRQAAKAVGMRVRVAEEEGSLVFYPRIARARRQRPVTDAKPAGLA